MVLIINESTGSPAQPAGNRPVFPYGIDKNPCFYCPLEVWEITVTAETRTPPRGLGATSLVQTGPSRDSSALLTPAQVGTACKRESVLVENEESDVCSYGNVPSTQKHASVASGGPSFNHLGVE